MTPGGVSYWCQTAPVPSVLIKTLSLNLALTLGCINPDVTNPNPNPNNCGYEST